MDCSLPGSSVHGVLQARILKWIAIPFFRKSSRPSDRTWVRQILYHLSHQGSYTMQQSKFTAYNSKMTFWGSSYLCLLLCVVRRMCNPWYQDSLQIISMYIKGPIKKKYIYIYLSTSLGFLGGSVVKNPSANAGDTETQVWFLGKSPGIENGNLLPYPCLENLMDRGAWQAIVHGLAKSWTWLSTHAISYKAPRILLTYCTFTPTSEKAPLPLLPNWEESWDGYATRQNPRSNIPWEERTATDNVRNSKKDVLCQKL